MILSRQSKGASGFAVVYVRENEKTRNTIAPTLLGIETDIGDITNLRTVRL